jgi:hypothetical protein
MKKILYALSFLCFLSVVSCTQELGGEDASLGQEAGTITLTLRSVEPQTKATMPGEASYNENLIKSVHYFFYPKDGTDSNTEKEPAKRGQATNLNKQNQHTITVSASENEIKNVLFKYPYNDCDVYVIVNLPETVDIDALPDRKLSTLKKIVVETAFEANLTQPCFVMEGLDVATVIDRNKVLAAQGVVPVDRVAAKITVSVNVQDQIDLIDEVDYTSGMKWVSEPEQMKIEFVNGVNRAVLSGKPDVIELTEEDRFTDNHSGRTFTSTMIDGEEFWTCAPFYSYPVNWEIGSDEEPYLFITLPWTTEIWTEVDGQEPPIYKTYPYYYKIMLGSNELKRNTWYDLKVNIGILGSFENTPEVILPIEEVDYFVADWSEGLSVDSEILGAKYLVVDKVHYELFNQSSISIPFTTSHDCKIVGVSCEYPNLKTGDDVPESASNYSIDIENGNTIKLTHELNNNMLSDDFDFTPFTFVFTIQHIDDPTYKKEITVVQYPAIYAEAKANSNWKGTSYSNAQNNDQNGYMYVNGYQGYTGDSRPNGVDFFLSAGGLYNNTSPNMYVFTVTTTEGTNYVIGDPRDTEYTYDAGDARWSSSPAIYNGNANRELNYYYGTLIANARYTNATNQTGVIYADDAAAEAAEPTINMIAPKFRLASGYSVLYTNTTSMTMENLKKRCASYQEDGYPAGRWRMPTRAEFQFIMTQVNKENLPELYYSGNSYWCAHGIGTPQDDGSIVMSYRGYATANNGYSVRCVYDEWYWENSSSYRLPENQKDTFTWGDMPRDQFDAKTE